MAQVLHSIQTSESPLFFNDISYGITRYGIDVTLKDTTFLLHFIKIAQFVQALLVGAHRQSNNIVIL
jgi:hypothetical protein